MELVLLNFPIKTAFRKAFLTPQSSLLCRFCVLFKPTVSCFLSKIPWIWSRSPLWSGSSLTLVSIAPALENFDSFPEVPPLCVPCSGSQPTQGHLELSQGLGSYSPFCPSSPGPLQLGKGLLEGTKPLQVSNVVLGIPLYLCFLMTLYHGPLISS